MAITLDEATAQLLTVNTAISDLISGKRLNELRIGSGATQRMYRYSEITLEAMYLERADLRSIIASLQPTLRPTFRTNTNIPLFVSK